MKFCFLLIVSDSCTPEWRCVLYKNGDTLSEALIYKSHPIPFSFTKVWDILAKHHQKNKKRGVAALPFRYSLHYVTINACVVFLLIQCVSHTLSGTLVSLLLTYSHSRAELLATVILPYPKLQSKCSDQGT